MNEAKYTSAEIVQLGKERYGKELRASLDTPPNKGKWVALDIETGDNALGSDSLEVLDALEKRRPHGYM